MEMALANKAEKTFSEASESDSEGESVPTEKLTGEQSEKSKDTGMQKKEQQNAGSQKSVQNKEIDAKKSQKSIEFTSKPL